MYLIHCAKCNNDMKYQPAKNIQLLEKPVKRCVYCGKNINVKKSILRQI
ncbi:MAG: hypothetical protein Q7R76_06960 [Candidatus Woesearchaeota archaeon]|nr:hypothetical protein [Candidatus Woesearchaeota archaeon]